VRKNDSRPGIYGAITRCNHWIKSLSAERYFVIMLRDTPIAKQYCFGQLAADLFNVFSMLSDCFANGVNMAIMISAAKERQL